MLSVFTFNMYSKEIRDVESTYVSIVSCKK